MEDDDPTTFFERMYVAAADGRDVIPWDRGAPHPLLEEWARDRDGVGRRALVVGSGLGADAELLAERGFDVVGFDASSTAVEMTRSRFADSAVDYHVANLLEPPARWRRAFELVLESLTVQSMAPRFHAPATANVAAMVAPGGTLLVIATAREESGEPPDGPPWPLTRTEIQAFAGDGVEPVLIEAICTPDAPSRWRAEFRRAP